MKHFLPAATRLASDLDHPVYDCLYLAVGAPGATPGGDSGPTIS